MKTQLLKILQLSLEDYELLVLDNYFLWCKDHSYNEDHLQNLLNSKRVFNWWQEHYIILEKSFVDLVKPYIEVTPLKAIRGLYTEETIQIRKYYPKTLLNAHKPRNSSGVVKKETRRTGHHLN